jgi:hypothetical protein
MFDDIVSFWDMNEVSGDREDNRNQELFVESSSSMSSSDSLSSSSYSYSSESSSNSSESLSSESFSNSSESISSESISSSSSADPYIYSGFDFITAFWDMNEMQGNRIDSRNDNVMIESSSSSSSAS